MKQCENCNNMHDGSYGSGRFCSSKCARGFSTKSKRKEINEKVSSKMKGQPKSEITKERISQSLKTSELFQTNVKGKKLTKEQRQKVSMGMTGRKFSDETKKKLSEIAKRNNLGGHTSKKSIHYITKSGEIVYLQSDFEVKVAKELDNNNIEWIRPEPLKWIDKNNEDHRYYPDFYLPEYDLYLDPKNDYLIKKDKDKIDRVSKQNNVKVLILSKHYLTWNKINSLIDG